MKSAIVSLLIGATAAQNAGTCYDSSENVIADCVCHETCGDCGKWSNPVYSDDCIDCAEGFEHLPIYSDNTGECLLKDMDTSFATDEWKNDMEGEWEEEWDMNMEGMDMEEWEYMEGMDMEDWSEEMYDMDMEYDYEEYPMEYDYMDYGDYYDYGDYDYMGYYDDYDYMYEDYDYGYYDSYYGDYYGYADYYYGEYAGYDMDYGFYDDYYGEYYGYDMDYGYYDEYYGEYYGDYGYSYDYYPTPMEEAMDTVESWIYGDAANQALAAAVSMAAIVAMQI